MLNGGKGKMTEIRCKKCNRLLLKGKVSEIEIKCPKCHFINSFRIITIDKTRNTPEVRDTVAV